MPAPRHRYWLHVLLLLATVLSTTWMGVVFARDFADNLPSFTAGPWDELAAILERPALLLHGLTYSLTLILILLAHEFGHYLACVYYRIDASLPYFLPAPTLVGTLGAFIRIRSPIVTKKALFDVGIAGPLAGFVVLLPVLAIGIAYSKIIPGIAERGELVFGTPVLQRLIELAIMPGVPTADLHLHPMARAAWVGMLATAINLLPIGQLDGGHILYAFAGHRHRLFTNFFLLALLGLAIRNGINGIGWFVLFLLLFIFGRKHPVIFDDTPLSPGRRALSFVALAVLVLCFTPTPVRLTGGL
jgi:membrane-associated protease RseP (regulator of RpoE activity)